MKKKFKLRGRLGGRSLYDNAIKDNKFGFYLKKNNLNMLMIRNKAYLKTKQFIRKFKYNANNNYKQEIKFQSYLLLKTFFIKTKKFSWRLDKVVYIFILVNSMYIFTFIW